MINHMKNLDHLKQKLEEEKKLLVGELKNIGVVKDKRSPDDWQATPEPLETLPTDPNEVADRIESYESNTALVSELESRLMDIDAALEKMTLGHYGACEVCKQPIEEDRLTANPAARTCKQHMNP